MPEFVVPYQEAAKTLPIENHKLGLRQAKILFSQFG